tara:strand:- start:6092 stop:7117 length:1026 start_codon:yes stop_codon:yes gene_type:complete
MKEKMLVGISIGDPNGIGLEIIIKSFKKNDFFKELTPIIYCPKNIFISSLKILEEVLDFDIINLPKNATLGKVNIIDFQQGNFNLFPGKATKSSGRLAYESLKIASNDLFSKKIDAIVTAPINKDNIQNSNFNFMGHTEYFTFRCELDESLMLMCYKKLRVGLVTNHLSVSNVSKNISMKLITKKINTFNTVLESDFNIKNPKLALLGLNPHSGDNGLIGNEEKKIIIPTIKELKSKNINVFGPFPADGFFANKNYLNYDGILAMYHDQGLIPFKVLSKNEGVNFTAGLPIIRTSPDHGTGYDIAGKGIANSTSFENALIMAKDIFVSRKNKALIRPVSFT